MSDKNTSTPRLQQIDNWLREQFPSTQFTIEVASSDASFRRYFRIKVEGISYILTDAPPEKEDTTAFVTIASFLYKQGINVPEIIAKDSVKDFCY